MHCIKNRWNIWEIGTSDGTSDGTSYKHYTDLSRDHCQFSNREGLGTSLQIMGLATTDPHSHKVQPKVYKIPKFGVNRPKSKQDTAIWKCQNLQRNVWAIRTLSEHRVRMAIHLFANFDVSQPKLAWLPPNLGILWISVCSFWLCGTIVAYPIIWGLVPSPKDPTLSSVCCCGYTDFNSIYLVLHGLKTGNINIWRKI